jgi:transposase
VIEHGGRGRQQGAVIVSETFDWFVGIDWATESHEVCVIDPAGAVVERRSVPHTGDGLRELADRLARLVDGQTGRVAVSIEVPHGAVVETLLERGFAVFSLNPKQLDRFRDRFSPAGAKDDRRDARVLADALRTDRHCFRRLAIMSGQTIRLRELTRTEEEIKEAINGDSNRLKELLHRCYPQILTLAPAADEPWVWALLDLAPTPAKGRKLHETSVERLLRQHRIRRLSAAEVCQALRSTPLAVAPGTVEAVSEHLAVLLPRLQLAHRQLGQVQKRVEAVLDELDEPGESAASPTDENAREHRDVDILLSAPGVGRVTAATMLAQANQAIKERDYHAFRAQAGLAPVTKASGKSCRVEMRRACDRRLRNACYHMARVASMNDPASRGYYTALRQRGHRHGRALRAVADRQLRILCAMLRDDTLFDKTRLPRAAAVPTSGI